MDPGSEPQDQQPPRRPRRPARGHPGRPSSGVCDGTVTHATRGRTKLRLGPRPRPSRVVGALLLWGVAWALPAPARAEGLPEVPVPERVYRERTGADTRLRHWWARARDSAYTVRSRVGDGSFLQRVRPDGDTGRWEARADGMQLVAVRQGRTLEATGTLDGEPVDRSFELGEDPWFQSIAFSLERFLRSDAREVLFRMLVPRELETVRLRAVRKGTGTIELHGRPVRAVRVEMRLAGWRSALWSAQYWFREDDGIFLRYEGRNGFPGTPDTRIEWLPARSPSRPRTPEPTARP